MGFWVVPPSHDPPRAEGFDQTRFGLRSLPNITSFPLRAAFSKVRRVPFIYIFREHLLFYLSDNDFLRLLVMLDRSSESSFEQIAGYSRLNPVE